MQRENFLSGIVVALDPESIGKHDQEILIAGIEFYGGRMSTRWFERDANKDPTLTHWVRRSSASSVACSGVQVVHPHYFEDCFVMKKRLPLNDYSLNHHKSICSNSFATRAINSSDTTTTNATAFTTTTDRHFLQGKRFYWDPHYPISLEQRQRYTQKALSVGALFVDTLEQSDCVLVNYRSNPCFIKASKFGKQTGTAYWLLHMLRHGKRVDTTCRLLHYPFPHQLPLQCMQSTVICVSGYHGPARQTLITLIQLCGATYKAELTPDTNLLIACLATGEKYQMAREWNINVVNHLWVESCWLSGQFRAVTEPAFQIYRSCLNNMVGMNEVVDGQKEQDDSQTRSHLVIEKSVVGFSTGTQKRLRLMDDCAW